MYIVSFRYTQAAGAYDGVITWTPFSSKEEFDKLRRNGSFKTQVVVEEGITQERAIELTRSTPVTSYRRVALFESTDPDTGKINFDLLQSRLLEFALVRSL
jgi:hypothetical protein